MNTNNNFQVAQCEVASMRRQVKLELICNNYQNRDQENNNFSEALHGTHQEAEDKLYHELPEYKG
jgi:hypothetical protein